MAGRARLYEANITWTGNRGQGTSAYTAYGRDHVVRGGETLSGSANNSTSLRAESLALHCKGEPFLAFFAADGLLGGWEETREKIRAALEKAGIELENAGVFAATAKPQLASPPVNGPSTRCGSVRAISGQFGF